MINPQELQLNNLVMYNGEEVSIKAISNEKAVIALLNSGDSDFVDRQDIHAIPLTPAILERCGFKEYDQSMYCHGITIGDNLLRIDLLQKTALLIHDLGFYPITNFPESLHHLQNLAAVLGQKLEVK